MKRVKVLDGKRKKVKERGRTRDSQGEGGREIASGDRERRKEGERDRAGGKERRKEESGEERKGSR